MSPRISMIGSIDDRRARRSSTSGRFTSDLLS
jgi:hypothetical protein